MVRADNASVVQERGFGCGTYPKRTTYLNKGTVLSQHILSNLHGAFQVSMIFCPKITFT